MLFPKASEFLVYAPDPEMTGPIWRGRREARLDVIQGLGLVWEPRQIMVASRLR